MAGRYYKFVLKCKIFFSIDQDKMKCSTIFNVLTISLAKNQSPTKNYFPFEKEQEDCVFLKRTRAQNKILGHLRMDSKCFSEMTHRCEQPKSAFSPTF